MEVKHPVDNFYFPGGGGEMGKLTREKDWTSTSVGASHTWPQSLRTTLSILLQSGLPMVLFWGPDLICFYNDAFRSSLGNEGKHPAMLGMKGEAAWAEAWPAIKPWIDEVLNERKAIWKEDLVMPIFRNGKIEEVYWSQSYSPVDDESGKPAGVFVVIVENTEKIILHNQLAESKNQLEFAIDAANLGTWDYNPLTNKFTANDRLKNWFGLPAQEEIELTHAIDVMIESDRQRVAAAIQKSFDYSFGGNYNIEYTIVHPVTKKETIVHAKGRAWFNNEKIAYRFNGTLEDITEQATARKNLEESEHRCNNLIHSSPSGIGILYGHDLIITVANEPIMAIWGKGKEIIGKPYFEVFPELVEQNYKEAFGEVYTTGKPFNMAETPVHLKKNGENQLRYYDFLLYPQRNVQNEIAGIGLIATEVTSYALLNAKVKNSEKRFRDMVQQAPLAICVFKGKDFIVEVANEKQLQIWDKRKEQVMNLPVFDAIPGSRGQGFEQMLEDAFTTGKRFSAQELPVTLIRNGKTENLFVNFSYEPFYNEENKIEGVMSVSTDVTEQVIARKQIEESESKFRALIAAAPMAIGVFMGRELVIENPNQEFINIVGKGAGIIGKRLTEAIPELIEHGQPYLKILDDVFTSGKMYQSFGDPVNILQNREIQDGFYDISYVPLFNAENKVYAILDIAINVTERIQFTKNIQESEERFQNLVRDATVGIVVLTGEEMKVEIVNEGYSRLLNSTPAELIGKNLFEIFPDAEAYYRPILNDVMQKGNPVYLNDSPYSVVTKGEKVQGFLNLVYQPYRNASGDIIGIVALCADVTEQVLSRNKIEESEQRFQAAVTAVQGILWTNNDKGEMEGEQVGWASLTGQTFEQYQGYGWIDALHPDDTQPTVDAWKTAVSQRSIFNFEHRLKTKEGNYNDFSVRAIPLLNRDGTLREWVGVHTDITIQKQQQQILLEREKKFSAMADNIPNLAWMAKADGWIYWYNKKWYDYTATTPEQMEGWGWQSVHHPEQLPRVMKKWQGSIESGQSFEMIFPLKGADGEFRQFLTRGLPIKDNAGEILQWFGTCTDITEQKETQDLLTESENRYRSLSDNMPMISFIMEPNANGTISYWNKTWLDYTGQTFKEALGRAWDGIIHPDDLPIVFDTYVPAFEKQQSYFIPAVRVKRHDDVYRWHLFTANPRFLPDGKFMGYIGVGFDIHNQKIAEDVLKESEERFRSLAQTLPHLVWVTDAQGNANFASFRWKEYTGFEPGGEKEWRSIVHPDDYDHINAAWVHSLNTGNIYKADVRLKNKDGEYRWHTVNGEPVYGNDNKIVKWVGAFTDRHAEKAFTKELELQVQLRTKELEHKNTDLEKLNKELQAFAYISSHDLQEPLRKIQTFATRIIEKEVRNLSDNGKDNFKRMQDAAKRMQTLIQDLLTYSRTNTEERSYELTNLNTIIDEVKEELKEDLVDKNATVEAMEMCEVNIIPFQFRQLLLNLIGNALKFSNPTQPPHITIKSVVAKGIKFNNPQLSPQKKYCHIAIADNGIGFEQEYSQKIFEVFQRLHGKEQYKGTGIGLAIVKKIVENHKGIITAKSELNQGATFDIYIPAP